VETGLFTGGTSVCIMRTLIETDLCGRRYWGFDSFAGAADAEWVLHMPSLSHLSNRQDFRRRMRKTPKGRC